MSLKKDLTAAIAEDARLAILKELAGQVDGRLSIVMIKRVLDSYGYRRDRDWIETQLRKLEALDAITLVSPGDVLIAQIERSGRDHIEERSILAGVSRPSDAE